MKVNFNVEALENIKNIADLLVELNAIKCKMSIDLKSNIVLAENFTTDDMIQQVVSLVDKYYNIVGVNIDNTNAYIPNTTNNIVTFSEYPNVINSLMAKLSWALNEKHVEQKYLVKFLYSLIKELDLSYSHHPPIEAYSGDIVECSFGTNLPGELSGNRTHGIVCKRFNEMVFIVPISPKPANYFPGYTCLKCTPKVDLIYDNFPSTSGTAVINQSGYYRIERVNAVLGKVSNGFMKRLLAAIAETYNFSKN